MKMIQITATVFATDGSGYPLEVFQGGKAYPVDGETERQVLLGNGVEVDVEEVPETAELFAAGDPSADEVTEAPKRRGRPPKAAA